MKLRRPLAGFMALVMVLSLMVFPVSAVEITRDSFELKADTTVIVDGTADQTVNVVLSAKEAMDVIAFEGTFSTKEKEDSSYITLTDYVSPVTLTGTNYFYVNNGAVVYADANLEGYSVAANGNVMTAVYTVDKDTPAGTYTVEFSAINIQEYEFNKVELTTYTATITVEEPQAPPAPYEIYYELDEGKLDSNDDDFAEYEVNDTVTATIYLQNNTDAALTLQAYDIYLEYQDLVYASHAMTGAMALEANSETEAAAGAIVTHIEAVSDAYKDSDADKTLPANGSLKLGTVSFTIDGDSVAYDQNLPISFKLAADAVNTADAEDVTNFSVGSEALGDKTSYYPTKDASEFDGAEVMTTYTVTYDANAEGDSVTDMPEEQTKQHNVDLDLSTAEPKRENYSFQGWNTEADGTGDDYAAGAAYTKNADVTLYAQWELNTVLITFVDEDGITVLYSTEVVIGQMPVYGGEEPTKDSTNQYTYEFAGWSPTLEAATVETTYTATYREILNEYTVTWYDQDGNVIETDENVAYGTALSTIAPANPSKDADLANTYTFAGWADAADAENGVMPENLGTVTDDAQFYAVFTETPIEYTVTFKDNSGETTKTPVYYEDTIELPNAAEKTGYTFVGWKNEDGIIVGGAGDNYEVLDNVTLTAEYTVNQYTIVFNGNGADSGSVESKTVDYDETFTMPENGFERTGWKFNGWNTASDGSGGTAYSAGQPYKELTTENSITLYAQWTQAEYTVDTEKVENGTLTAPENANYDEQVEITVKPEDGYKIKDGKITYTYTDDEGNTKTEEITVTDNGDGTYTGTLTMPDADIVVSTVFVPKDLNVNVAENIENGTVVPDTSTAKVGETVTLTTTPDEGYELGEITVKDANNKDIPVNDNGTFTMPNTDVTVTATFVAIEYSVNIGTTTGGTVTAAPNKAIIGTTIQLTANPETGYKWVSYTVTRDDGKGTVDVAANGTFTMPASHVNVTAEFTNITYKVSFNANGGTGEQMADMDADYGTSTPLSANTYTRVGYEFVGWALSAGAAETEVITHADNLTTEDGATVPVYAIWKEATYSVTLEANGGTIAEGKDVTEYIFGTGATLPTAADITKTGYTFDGWYAKADFSGDKVTAIGTDATGEKTFYAKWTAIKYYITFKDGNSVIGEPVEYTVESNYELPEYTKANYTFVNWKITETDAPEAWTVNGTIDAGTKLNEQFYGNVTLTANLTFMAHLVESYKYADSDYVMLRVADDLEDGQVYKFNGETMFWTDDPNYLNELTGATSAFYTLVEKKYVDTATFKLNAEGEALLTTGEGAHVEINRESGDINGDTVVNIADANIVYQMTKYTGSYYADMLSIEQRLMADMDTTPTTGDAEFRGSIDDVEVIVDIINGTTANG